MFHIWKPRFRFRNAADVRLAERLRALRRARS
jgi:hypothetical protein